MGSWSYACWHTSPTANPCSRYVHTPLPMRCEHSQTATLYTDVSVCFMAHIGLQGRWVLPLADGRGHVRPRPQGRRQRRGTVITPQAQSQTIKYVYRRGVIITSHHTAPSEVSQAAVYTSDVLVVHVFRCCWSGTTVRASPPPPWSRKNTALREERYKHTDLALDT